MLKILLADDNLLTLNQLGEMIDGSGLPAVVAGQAMDGRRAAQLLEELDPDILITDVDMPLMNGVELVQLVRERGLRAKVIALSNFDSFHFVKPILKCGAVDYLLKHELTQELLIQKIEEARRQLEQDARSARQEQAFSLAARQGFLKNLILGLPCESTEQELMLRRQEFLCSQNALSVLQIVGFQILYHSHSPQERSRVVQSVLRICTSVCGAVDNGLACALENGEFALFFHFENAASQQRIYEQAREYAALVAGNLRRLLNLGMLMETVVFTGGILQVRQSYLQAHARLMQQPFSQMEGASEMAQGLKLSQEQQLIEALTQGDRAAVKRIAQQAVLECCAGGGPVQPLVMAFIRIGEQVRSSRGGRGGGAAITAFQNKFRRSLLPQEICAGVLDYLDSVCACAASRRYSEYVQKAVGFIYENYAREISLEEMASAIGISSVYLSKIFKAETGSSFVDFVNEKRLEAARRLLRETGLSVREISEQVGMPNYSYFIRLFREKNGVTPLRFRRGRGNSGEEE